MNNEQKAETYSNLVSTYKLLGYEISPNEGRLLVNLLAAEHDFDQVQKAIKQIACTMTFRPRPTDFLEILEDKPTPLEADVEVLKIKKAISDHGWCNPGPAKEACGEKVWQVVERLGGWVEVCKWEYDSMSYNLAHAAKIYRAVNDKKRIAIDGEIKIKLEAQNGTVELDKFVIGEKISNQKDDA